jgi:hypothetical protein
MAIRITVLLAVLAAALTLGGGAGAGAGTASQSPTKMDLTSRAAVDTYLRSIGVNPATVVRQTGRLNYAGPNCPGSQWNCTSARRVVQMSTAGGQNVFDCAGNTNPGPGQTCVIVQGTGRNTASCVEHSTTESEQHCTITQAGTRNFARVDQLLSQDGVFPQDATQTVDVKQSGATAQNELQVDQGVTQDTSTGTTQAQDVHQYVLLDQGANGGGNNFAHVHQSQDQGATGSATTQDQNTNVPSSFSTLESACNAAASSASNGLVTTPNACAKFTQTSVNGGNEAHLHQFANESETSTASAAQSQGSNSNGLGGGFEQTVTGTGSSHNHTVQHKLERATSNGGNKNQVDPIGCCGASQVGGVNNLENIDQMSTQSADGGFFSQNSDLVGTSDSPTGTCSVSHHVRENEASTNVNQSDNTPPCSLDVTTSCNSFNVEGTSGNCTTTSCPPNCPGLVTAPSPVVTVVASIPTLGQALPPLDVTTEPSSYALPSWYVPF